MKRLLLSMLILLFSVGAKSQNTPNPYASIGKPAPKMVTVTNGSYDEFLLKQPLVLINGDAVDRKTGDMVYSKETNPEMLALVEKDQKDKFRFLSVDPLTNKFAMLSPYQYAGDSPIENIDLDGLEPKSVIYQDNSALPKINLMPSSTIQYNLPKNAVIQGGDINPKPTINFSPESMAKIQSEISKLPKGGRLEQSFDPITDVMLGGGLFKATKSAFADDAAKTLLNSEDEMVKIYRGINESHVGFDDAMKGITKPRGGDASALEHNLGNTNSPFTSWTTDPDVAKNYALRPNGEGVILEKVVPKSELYTSPSLKRVNLIQSPGTKVNEAEVLLKGPIKEAKVSSVKP